MKNTGERPILHPTFAPIAVQHVEREWSFRLNRSKAKGNRESSDGTQVYWSRHAITEMVQDQLTRSEVEAALEECDVIEDYPTMHRPLPDYLVFGQLQSTEPIHAVIAIDEARNRIFVVTVYRPSPERWEDDWRTRK